MNCTEPKESNSINASTTFYWDYICGWVQQQEMQKAVLENLSVNTEASSLAK